MKAPKSSQTPGPAPADPVQSSPEPARVRSLARHLPRAGLILFLVAMLVVFHEILLPFVLAIFFSYLIYPVVNLIERIPIGTRRLPRWLAVISIYAVLFTVGWIGVPPLFNNVVGQVGKLGGDVPKLFSWLQEQRKTIDAYVAKKLEVPALDEDTRKELYKDVDDLATGALVALPPAADLALPLPVPLPAGTTPVEPSRTVVQLFALNLQFGDGKGADANASDRAATATHDPAGTEEPDRAEPSPTDPPAQDPVDRPRRFEETAAQDFKTDLREQLDAELGLPGAAKGLPERIERDIVPALIRKHLLLPEGDRDGAILARNAAQRVAAATKQEEYAKLINGYVVAGVDAARVWVQEQLKQLTGLVTGLVHGVFDFFMILMLTAFFLLFFPRIRDYLQDLVPPQYREDYGNVLKRIDVRLSGAIRGQVIICLVNAALTFPGLWFIGRHTAASSLASYAVLLSLVAGVLSMIPIFGVILSTVPMVMLALTQQSIAGALLVIAWIAIIHAIEAYLLNPNILGHSASMNPIIVVFALIAGKHIGGLTGALLAVPVASVVVSLFGYYRRLVAERYAAEAGVALPQDPWGD